MRYSLLIVFLASCSYSLVSPADEVVPRPAVVTPQALKAVTLDLCMAGSRIIAVGERGIILFSDDNGIRWQQAQVPVSSTLTAVQFIDSRNGWAVGHAGVVLHTSNGGESWALQMDGHRAAALELHAAQTSADESRIAMARQGVADGADKPFLAVSFSDASNGMVVGAFGLALVTADGGMSWTSVADRLPNPEGLHLYAVARQGDYLYLAGERGLLLRSRDRGGHFEALQAPYDGSYFAMAVGADGGLFIAGLRGKVFRSADHGQTFQAIENPVPISVNSIYLSADGAVVANQAGGLLKLSSDLARLTPMVMPNQTPLTALVRAADDAFVGTGFTGPVRLAISLNASE